MVRFFKVSEGFFVSLKSVKFVVERKKKKKKKQSRKDLKFQTDPDLTVFYLKKKDAEFYFDRFADAGMNFDWDRKVKKNSSSNFFFAEIVNFLFDRNLKAACENRDESLRRKERRRIDVAVIIGIVVVVDGSARERNNAKRWFSSAAAEVAAEEVGDVGERRQLDAVVERRQVGQLRRRTSDGEAEHARRERKGGGL